MTALLAVSIVCALAGWRARLRHGNWRSSCGRANICRASSCGWTTEATLAVRPRGQLWSSRFGGSGGDLPHLSTQLAEQIAGVLKGVVGVGEVAAQLIVRIGERFELALEDQTCVLFDLDPVQPQDNHAQIGVERIRRDRNDALLPAVFLQRAAVV